MDQDIYTISPFQSLIRDMFDHLDDYGLRITDEDSDDHEYTDDDLPESEGGYDSTEDHYMIYD